MKYDGTSPAVAAFYAAIGSDAKVQFTIEGHADEVLKFWGDVAARAIAVSDIERKHGKQK